MAAEEAGVLTVDFADSQEARVKEVMRASNSLVSQAAKIPAGVTVSALPTIQGTPYKARRIILSFTSIAADTIESEESEVQIPVAFLNERTLKQEFARDLTLADFIGFTPAGAVDVVCAAGVKQRLCYYDAPEGYVMTLAAGQRWHFYLGDDT